MCILNILEIFTSEVHDLALSYNAWIVCHMNCLSYSENWKKVLYCAVNKPSCICIIMHVIGSFFVLVQTSQTSFLRNAFIIQFFKVVSLAFLRTQLILWKNLLYKKTQLNKTEQIKKFYVDTCNLKKAKQVIDGKRKKIYTCIKNRYNYSVVSYFVVISCLSRYHELISRSYKFVISLLRDNFFFQRDSWFIITR